MLAGEAAHLGQCGHAHVIVVQPDAVGHGTVAGQGAVGKAFLPGGDIIDADVNERPEIAAHPGLLRFEEGGGHRAAIVQGGRFEEVLQGIGLGAFGGGRGLDVFGDQAQSPKAFGGEVLETRVAGRLGGQEHSGVSDAPFVTDEAKVARREAHPPGKPGQVGDALLCVGVQDGDGAGGVQVIHHAPEHGGDVGDRGRSVRDGIIGLEPAEDVRAVLSGGGRLGRRGRRGAPAERGAADGALIDRVNFHRLSGARALAKYAICF